MSYPIAPTVTSNFLFVVSGTLDISFQVGLYFNTTVPLVYAIAVLELELCLKFLLSLYIADGAYIFTVPDAPAPSNIFVLVPANFVNAGPKSSVFIET